MANYRIVLEVNLPQVELFDYLATLSNTKDWEPSTAEGRNVGPEALGLGSTFEIEIRSRRGTRPFTFQIVEFDAPQWAVIDATTRALYARYTIQVRKVDEHTSEMNFESVRRHRGFSAIFNSLLFIPMRRIGKRARLNLERTLSER